MSENMELMSPSQTIKHLNKSYLQKPYQLSRDDRTWPGSRVHTYTVPRRLYVDYSACGTMFIFYCTEGNEK